MRFFLSACFSLLVAVSGFAAAPPPPQANARTIRSLPDFPLNHLKMSLSPRLFKSLCISPVTAWVVAQAPSGGGTEPKIVRSDAGGDFDKMALEMAKGWAPVGFNTTESRTHSPTLMVHLLVYKIADGLMAVNFSHNDEAFYQGIQRSDVWVGVYRTASGREWAGRR